MSSREDAPAIQFDSVVKDYGRTRALAGIDLTVQRGQIFGFLGPNGAGKTTTVRTLGTLIAPTSGSATVAGIPLAPENGVDIRRRIAIMPETPGLYSRLTVAENLQCFADPDVGRIRSSSIRIEVVFPAPFGPRNPKIWARSTVRSMPLRARVRP